MTASVNTYTSFTLGQDAGKPPWAMHPERRSIARHAPVVAWNRPPHHHKRVCTAGKTGLLDSMTPKNEMMQAQCSQSC